MTEREKEMRTKVRLECWGKECNFQGIDYLMKMENDWRVAQKEGDYSFDSCPSSFDCLGDFVGLCELNDEKLSYKDSVEQCKECWKKALRGE